MKSLKKAILISCFDWYKKRLEPIRDFLVNQDYEVTVLTSDFNHIKKTEIEKRHPECTYIHVPSYRKNISLNRIKSHLFFGKCVKNKLDQINPDFIYLLLPPNNTAKYCSQYKKLHPDTKLIVDIIDLWPESMPIGFIKKTPFAWIWKKWRDDAVKNADYVFTECAFYQEKLSYVLNPEKTSKLYLFKEQAEKEKKLVQEIIKDKKDDGIIRFAYLGSMNNIIDIDGICNVLKVYFSSGKKCELHAIGDGVSREKFETSVREMGCETFFYGSIFDEIKKIKILTPCDYALNMMKDFVHVGLTIKSIDYLSYGLPLINNIKGDTWKMVEEKCLGINVLDTFTTGNTFDHNRIVSVFDELFTRESFVNMLKVCCENIFFTKAKSCGKGT